jgi:hypothetical protein
MPDAPAALVHPGMDSVLEVVRKSPQLSITIPVITIQQ